MTRLGEPTRTLVGACYAGTLPRALANLIALISIFACCGCVPSFELFGGSGPANIPSGPKISDLLDNVACELAEAAQSEAPIPVRAPDRAFAGNPLNEPQETFSLRDELDAIRYAAVATYTLDVTNLQAISPSVNFINPLATAMTNFTLSVGGQLSEQEHRNITLNETIDFERFSQGHGLPQSSCAKRGRRSELGGDLQLSEILSMGLMANVQNEVALCPNIFLSRQKLHKDDKPVSAPPPPLGNLCKDGETGVVPTALGQQVAGSAQYGVFGSIIDFTIVEGANGGPNWTLVHFKGPIASSGGSQPGLLNVSRTVKDTLNISFVPLCVQDDAIKNYYNSHHKQVPFPIWATASQLGNCKDLTSYGLSIILYNAINNNINQLLQQISPTLVP